MTVVKLVSSATDGTGDYICDGHADQTVINNALSWMSAGTDRQVYMRGPFTYGITDQLFIGNNTDWTGDSTACIRVEDYACGNNIPYGSSGAYCVFPDGTPVIASKSGAISNIKIHGFEIDGNCQNQYLTLGYVGHLHTPRSAGSGVERLIGLSSPSNVYLYDMHIHDAFDEALMVFYGRNIQCYNNVLTNLEHDAVFLKGVTGNGNSIHHNTVEGIGSDCIRVGSSQNVDIYNNSLTPYLGPNATSATNGQNGMQISNESNYTILINNINVYNNYIVNNGLAGIEIIDVRNTAGSKAQTIHIYNNTINNNGSSGWATYCSGINLGPWGNGVLIEGNTISGNYQNGIQVASAISGSGFTVNSRNNNISNTIGTKYGSKYPYAHPGYGIANSVSKSTMNVISTNDIMKNNLKGNYYGAVDVISTIQDQIQIDTNMGMRGSNNLAAINLIELTSGIGIAGIVIPDTKGILEISVDIGMYGSDPSLEGGDDGEDIKEGDYGLMIPTASHHYIFHKYKTPSVGQKALIYPSHKSGTYYLLRVAEHLLDGQPVVIIPDKTGKFWPILAR